MTDDVTPGKLRERAATALAEPGARRQQLRQQLGDVENELRPLVVAAVRAEVPGRRIRELTGLSTNTAAAWARQAEQ